MMNVINAKRETQFGWVAAVCHSAEARFAPWVV